MSDYIKFKQQRESGEIVSSTFRFIRENYKSFLRLLFKNAGPALILLIAALGYYSYANFGSTPGPEIFNSGSFLISYGILALSLALYYAAVYSMAFNLIQSYIDNKGRVIEEEVSAGVKHDFGKMFLLIIVSGVFIFVGMLFFLLPGIYLIVPLNIATAVFVFSRSESITESIREAFFLIKDNWWASFFALVMVGLIVYVISMVFQLPLIIYTFLKAFTIAEEGSAANMEDFFDWVYLLLMMVSSLIQYLFYSIIPIGVAFLYFHLNEKKHFTGAYESIDKLGKDS